MRYDLRQDRSCLGDCQLGRDMGPKRSQNKNLALLIYLVSELGISKLKSQRPGNAPKGGQDKNLALLIWLLIGLGCGKIEVSYGKCSSLCDAICDRTGVARGLAFRIVIGKP